MAGAVAGLTVLPYLVGGGALLYVRSVADSECYKKARKMRTHGKPGAEPRGNAELLADVAAVAAGMALVAPRVALTVAGAHGIGQLIGDVARDEFRQHARNSDPFPIDYIIDLGVTSAATLILLTGVTGSVARALPLTALSTVMHGAVHMAVRQVVQDGWIGHRSAGVVHK